MGSRISLSTLQKIARLSGLELTVEKERRWDEDLNQIFTWIDQMGEVDTSSTAPLVNNIESFSLLCEDQPANILNRDAVLQNAPKSQYGYFLVPKVME